MYITLETAKQLVEYQKLKRENEFLKSENDYYIKVIKKYEAELLKIEKRK